MARRWSKLILLMIFLFAFTNVVVVAHQLIIIPAKIALPIGLKIWFNECGGKVDGLTSWNEGEGFASLGIGHSIWHPRSGSASYKDGFPGLLVYMEAHGVILPIWLQGEGKLYCPWSTRDEFLRARNSAQMRELRAFLQHTIAVQAQYMAHKLELILPKMLAHVSPGERPYICQQFYTLARKPMGLYAMIDYLNFKGAGINIRHDLHQINRGSGLLQVLEGMRFAPVHMTPLQAYVWSAKAALVKRVLRLPPRYHAERWLAGWITRLNTYLDD